MIAANVDAELHDLRALGKRANALLDPNDYGALCVISANGLV